jgi:hypothetical protein
MLEGNGYSPSAGKEIAGIVNEAATPSLSSLMGFHE